MLNALLCLYGSIDSGRRSRYTKILAQTVNYSDVMVYLVPAAAAGSTAGLLFSSLVVEVDFGAKGLRLLCRAYAFLLTGERESRSKRDERLTSDSVWSNLERLEVRRSSSAI